MDEKDILFYIKSLDNLIFKKIMKGKDIKKHPSPTQIRIIRYMFEHQNEDINQKTLENHLNLSRATVSDVLKTMEKNNYIKKVPDIKDARANKIILNSKTIDIHKQMLEEIHIINNIIKKDISDEDLSIFINVIKQMHENLKKYPD